MNKKIAFVLSRELDLICMQSLVAHFRANPRLQTQIFTIPFGVDGNATKELIRTLESKNWSCQLFDEALLRQQQFDYVFAANPYFADRAYEIIGNVSKLIYIPYACSISGEEYTDQLHYNGKAHQLAWRIYAVNDFYKELYACHCSVKGRNVKVINTTPKFDNIIQSFKSGLKENPEIFLWNIHFNIVPQTHGDKTERTWSAYSAYHDAIFRFFQEHPEKSLIIRPHPNLQYLVETKDFLSQFTALANVTVEKSWSKGYEESFNKADVLITDLSSMFFDFCITGKPIITLTYEKSCRLNAFAGNLFRQFAYFVDSPEQLNEKLSNLINGNDTMKKRRIGILENERLFRLSRPACEIIAEDIGVL